MNTITIAIVNWNTGRLLAKCLTSLLMLPASERELIHSIIVVDNASADDSLSYARQAAASEKKVQFIEQKENIGFAKANNVVLAQHTHSSDVFLLNPDTEVHPGAIQELHDCLQRNPKVGIVGAKLLNADGSLQPSVRSLPTWAVLLFYAFKLNRLLPESRLWRRYLLRDFDYNREQKAPQVMGAAFLIRKQTLKEVGLLDESFWIWFEEVDYCKRAAEAGWDIMYTPKAQIAHYGGVSFGQWAGWRRYIEFMRSAARYAWKHLI